MKTPKSKTEVCTCGHDSLAFDNFVKKLKEEIESHIAGSDKFYDDNPDNLLIFIDTLAKEFKMTSSGGNGK